MDSGEEIDSSVLGSKQEWDDNPQGGYTMYRYREVSLTKFQITVSSLLSICSYSTEMWIPRPMRLEQPRYLENQRELSFHAL